MRIKTGDQQLKILNATTLQRQKHRMDKLLHNLQNPADGQPTCRDLKNSHGFSGEEVDELMLAFPGHVSIEVIQNPKGGPKSPLALPRR